MNKNLYYLRNQQNLGLDELGKELSMSRGIYSSVEKNENPKIGIVKSIFDFYKNIDADFTFDMLIYEDLEKSEYRLNPSKQNENPNDKEEKSLDVKLQNAREEYEKKLELETLSRLLRKN